MFIYLFLSKMHIMDANRVYLQQTIQYHAKCWKTVESAWCDVSRRLRQYLLLLC